MSKSILTIGLELASESTHEEEFDSKASLLDWDIVLFKPTIDDFTQHCSDQYEGKPCLDDTWSFSLKEACEHWRHEIKQAFEIGKTVVVFLPPIEEVFVATGRREYSGTGRYQKTTRIVERLTNYRALPLELTVVNSMGSAIAHAARHEADRAVLVGICF